MGLGSGDFAKLRPERLTLLGALRSAFRRAMWKTFPGILLPSPAAIAQRVMDDHGVPAMAVAIAKGGTILFSQGFGSTGPHMNEPVTGDSLFRIASNSKAITAAGIHVLAERGVLSLSERVFGGTGILGTSYGGKPYSNWLTQIEVRHLLEHSAGGWGSKSNDPMFQTPALTHAALIGATLDADLLERPPGVQFIYSNFGYCVLGRIIERRTGQTYEDFVRRSVLIPAGSSGMRIGQDTLAGRAPGEVVYVSAGGGSPYDLPVRRMDSHGGWISSATDYVRFLLAIDKAALPPDVLAAASVTAMRTRSKANDAGDYGQGVGTNEMDIWHNGALLGTRAVMWCGTGGDAWCVLCTGGPPPGSKKKKDGDPLLAALDKMMWRLWDLV
jgi:CubicO group peptidase (beta-lactamase class C family)